MTTPMPRRKSSADEPHAVTFEESLASLEAIIEAMEHEQLPLEQLVENYEKGSAILKHCEAVLQSARSRIELITLRNQSEQDPDFQSATHPSTPDEFPDDDEPTDVSEDSDDDSDDIRLF